MPPTIRLATPDDTPGVVRTIKTVYDEYGFTWDAEEYHADLYDLDGHYFQQGDSFYVAETEEGIVGTVALQLFPTLPGRTGDAETVDGRIRAAAADCSLERLYVHPDARRQGLGRILTQRVIDDARAAGRHVMELWSDKRFVDAHRLYQKMGAEVIGDRICHDPDQSPEWGLIIRL